MCKSNNGFGQVLTNQCVPKNPPKPTLLASVYICKELELANGRNRRIFFPLKFSTNNDHASKSALADFFNLRLWCGFCMPFVKSMIRRKKALPGTTTMQVKLSSPGVNPI